MNTRALRQSYNLIAKDFASEHYEDSWDDDYLQYVVDESVSGAKVLDLGCGAGNDTAKLAEAGLAAEGVDLSDEFVRIAKERNPEISFRQGNMLELPYADEEFDALFAKASLLHIAKSDMPRCLSEMWRVLKTGGTIHIALKGGEGEGEIIENDYGYEYTRFFSYWKLEEFKPLLEEHGFKVSKGELYRSRPTSYTIWIKILAKKTKLS